MVDNEKLPTSASLIRSKYARVFECVVELYNLKTNERSSTKFEDVVKITEEMHENKYLSDYLYENLNQIYDLYPTMLRWKVASGYKENPIEEENRLNKIDDLLSLLIEDLNNEIADIAELIAEKQTNDLIGEDK